MRASVIKFTCEAPLVSFLKNLWNSLSYFYRFVSYSTGMPDNIWEWDGSLSYFYTFVSYSTGMPDNIWEWDGSLSYFYTFVSYSTGMPDNIWEWDGRRDPCPEDVLWWLWYSATSTVSQYLI